MLVIMGVGKWRHSTKDSESLSDLNNDKLKITMSSKLSFTIRRPTPVSQHSSTNASPKPQLKTYNQWDESDDSDGEVVVAQGPLVIPSLQDRDWRELARKRRSINRYIPASAGAMIGVDGDRMKTEGKVVTTEVKQEAKEEETEDQKAIRALLSGTFTADEPQINIIPVPVSETDAYRQDVKEYPDEATLEDHTRVPVSQFGAALLRGMGWKEGDVIGKRGKGMKEPWIPQARPALLGIGAKEQEVYDDGSGGKGGALSKTKRPEKRYVPLLKQEREGSGSGSREGSRSRRTSPPARDSGRSSRRASRSPQPASDRYKERERNGRDRGYRDRARDRDWDGRKNGASSEREREGDRDKDRYRDRDNRSRRDGERY